MTTATMAEIAANLETQINALAGFRAMERLLIAQELIARQNHERAAATIEIAGNEYGARQIDLPTFEQAARAKANGRWLADDTAAILRKVREAIDYTEQSVRDLQPLSPSAEREPLT